MAIAQAKTSRARRDKRRSHHKLQAAGIAECPNCHQVSLQHNACPHCGYYKGRQVIKPREA
ncbi:MAG: 50S ribosomal protein L32 [Calditrichaeota bacterium]|nr:50S ribosomal protein L32 [Calditrichota bacterium]